MDDYVWNGLRLDGESRAEAGVRLISAEDGNYSYRSCRVGTTGNNCIGMYQAALIEEKPSVDKDTDPILRPYLALLEPDSFFIWNLACLPEYRDQGFGGRLINNAKEQAQLQSLKKVALIAFEENVNAIRFYERHGFAITGREAVVPHDLIAFNKNAFQMIAELD